jgi:hypothetical protein
MKKERTIRVLTLKPSFAFVSFATSLVLSLTATSTAFARADLDRQYALESVGFLPSWDNVDGLFQEYVAAAYKDYFSHQSRFVVQDISKTGALLTNNKLPYQKVLEDKDVLAQVARTTHSQTLIRTRILKEGPQYRLAMEWLHAPKMEPLAVEALVLKEPAEGQSLGTSDVTNQIKTALGQMIAKIPFQGHVTGRDGNSVTLNIGATAGLKRGDTIVLSTLDDVKIHPLLGIIVDWRLTKTGRVEVDSVDEGIAFCHVTDEEPGHQVGRYQKVTQIIPAVEDTHSKILDDNKHPEDEMPHLGYFSGGLLPGGFSREFDSSTAGASRTGGGINLGAQIEGQIWFTRELFAEAGYTYDFYHLGQSPPGQDSNTLSSGANLSMVDLAVGYSYSVTGDFFGPKGWLKLGYRSTSYNLPSDAAESIGPISFHSLFFGLGGDLPVRNGWGAILNFDLGIANGADEGTGFSNGGVASATDVDFLIGGYYHYSNRMTFRVGFDVHDNGADFDNGNSLSQKVISIAPAIIYYF